MEKKEEETHWHRQQRVRDEMPTRLLTFAVETFGEEALAEAWDEFYVWDENAPDFDPESVHMPVFMPWFFYDWTPNPADTDAPPAVVEQGKSPAALYLAEHGARLEPLARRYLEASLAGCFSFHEIVDNRPGEGLTLVDLIGGQEYEVIERSASRSVSTGQILFARVVHRDHMVLLDGCGPVPIPAAEKPYILELRQFVDQATGPITADLLRDIDLEMFELYHAIVGDLLEPRMPMLANTDGEAFAFYQVVFELDTAQGAFDALHDLALDGGEAGLLDTAEYDRDGKLYRIEIPWLRRGNAQHARWDNTVLGHLFIEGQRLTVEVNSESRAVEIQELVEQRLGEHARYLTTEVQSPEAALADADFDERPLIEDNFASDAEVDAAVRDVLIKHYADWPNQPLPALNGRTPVAAVQDPAARAQIQALIVDIERKLETDQPDLVATIIPRLRADLGL